MTTRTIEAVRERLRDDFEFYAANALKIRTKSEDESGSNIIPFTLNRAQKHLLDKIEEQRATNHGVVRIIILKGRQQGLSTLVGGWIYHKVTNGIGKRAIVVAHKGPASDNLFKMVARYHRLSPEILRPSTSYSSRKELVFDVLDSSYTVETAGGEGIGRSETLQYAHLSEVAFWPKNSAREAFGGLEDSLPWAPGTAIFIESTASGTAGFFYDTWQDAVAGKNGFLPVFIPWYWQHEYVRPVPEGFVMTPDEEELVKKVKDEMDFDLQPAQLMFRREKVGLKGLDLFNQEYPSTPAMAFIASGMQVFASEHVAKQLKRAIDPIAEKALILETLETRPAGPFKFYKPFREDGEYYIGADVAMGIRGGDYSVAVVLDENKEVVCVYRDHVHPDHYAKVLDVLGRFYNEAFIIAEANNHGILTLSRLFNDYDYTNVFMEVTIDKITEQETKRLGFLTTAKSKPMILDELRAAIRDEEIKINDRTVIGELRSMIATPEGKYEASPGTHDDCVIALALANHVHEGKVEVDALNDDYYIEAI